MDAQALYDLFRSRQSDRHYDTTRAISREVLQRIVENALLAPEVGLRHTHLEARILQHLCRSLCVLLTRKILRN